MQLGTSVDAVIALLALENKQAIALGLLGVT
jgi:hypothetical protein